MSTTLTIRRIGPSDVDAMHAYLEGLSDHDRYMRFLRPLPRIPAALTERLCATDEFSHVAIGVFEDDRLVAVARYVRLPGDPSRAELAFSVRPTHRRRGLARRLVDQLVDLARDHGLSALEVFVHPENAPAAALVRSVGFGLRYRDGLLEGCLPLA